MRATAGPAGQSNRHEGGKKRIFTDATDLFPHNSGDTLTWP